MMPAWAIRILIAAVGAAVCSAFCTPLFHALVTKQGQIPPSQQLAWFGIPFAVLFLLIWLLLGRRG